MRGAEAGGDEPIVVLLASRLFSRSSFVAVERSMTTWPEQILWTEAESICLIVPVISFMQTASSARGVDSECHDARLQNLGISKDSAEGWL